MEFKRQPMKNRYPPSIFAYDVGDSTKLPTPINESTLGKTSDAADVDHYQHQLEKITEFR